MLETLVPRLRPGVSLHLRSDGSGVLVEGTRGLFVEIAADQASLLALFDGARSLATIVAEHLTEHRSVSVQALVELLSRLRAFELLANDARELEDLGIAPARPARSAWLRLARVRAPGLGAASLAFSALALGAMAVIALLALGREVVWADPQPEAWTMLVGALAGASAALALRSIVLGAFAALAGSPPAAVQFGLQAGVPTLELETGGTLLLDRPSRAASYLLALGAQWGLVASARLGVAGGLLPSVASAVALGAAVAAFLDCCPFARTSLGQLLATAAGRVDLGDHARAYLSRRFLTRIGRRAVFTGERVILLTAALSLLWTWAAAELLLRFGTRESLRLLARAAADPGFEAAAAWLLAALWAIAAIGALFLFVRMVARALDSLVPSSMRDRPSRGRPVPRGRDPLDARAALRASPLFAMLPDAELSEISQLARFVGFGAGSVIVRQGDLGEEFFAVVSGLVDVEREQESGLRERVAVLSRGDCFGEVALLADQPRSATVRARTDVIALALSRTALGRLAAAFPHSDLTRLIRASAALHRSPLFRPIGAERLAALVPKLRPRSAAAGEVVLRRGEQGDEFFLIDHGELEVLDPSDEKRIALLGPGDCFGEIALLRGVARVATVRAVKESALWGLGREDFFAFVAGNLAASQTLEAQARERAKKAA